MGNLLKYITWKGRIIMVKKDDVGQHHYITVSWVVSTDNGKVKIDRPGEEAMAEW